MRPKLKKKTKYRGLGAVDPVVFDLKTDAQGRVTLYHGTTKAGAKRISASSELCSAGEPDVYLTTDKSGAGYGDGAVVAVKVDPARLELDDEFPGGRLDFRIPLPPPLSALDGRSLDKVAQYFGSHGGYSWNARTRVFGMHGDARGVAKPLAAHLERLGFEVTTSYVDNEKPTTSTSWGSGAHETLLRISPRADLPSTRRPGGCVAVEVVKRRRRKA